jgi:hypothetical protein
MQMKIAVLTSSYKKRHNGDSGRCVAGISENWEWVRLVSDSEGDSLPTNAAPNTRIIIDVQTRPVPLKYQPENQIFLGSWAQTNDSFREFMKNFPPTSPKYIFYNNDDRVPYKEIDGIGKSLLFVTVNSLEIYSDTKCNFKHNGLNYSNISMTDPNYYHKRPGNIGDAHIVVSLPSDAPFMKFVAAIYPAKR